MPRILHVLDHSLPLHSGYTFRTRAILNAQLAMGWHVEGVTGVRQYQGGQEMGAARETVDGLTFHRTLANIKAPSPVLEWREVAALTQRIVELHRENPFDLLHAHSPVINGLAAMRAARILKIPFLYEIRAFWEDAAVGNGTGSEGSAKYRLTRALETHVARRADAVAVICEGLRNDLIKRHIPASKIMVSPNGVDMGLFGDAPPRDDALARELGLPHDADVLGFIGSFYDYEGLDDLIEAMPMLAQRQTDAGEGDAGSGDDGAGIPHLILVGGGPRTADLEIQAKASPMAKYIHFIGRVPHEEVSRYYSLIDLLVYPRKPMRLTDLVTPLKPLEAMAQGRLVVASDVGGHKELIEDGVTGALFTAGSPSSLANATAAMLADRNGWDERRAVARAYVASERDWAKNVQRYEPVYQMLLGLSTAREAA
jgi:PEP-CTERM/exosortase A-associated glycosyltransferase